MDLKELEQGIDLNRHGYYQTKRLPLEKYFFHCHGHGIQTLADVGAGSGFFSDDLCHRHQQKIIKAWQADIGYSDEEMSASKEQQIEKVLSIPDQITDTLVLLMHVLEHLEDDLGMLQKLRKYSRGENRFSLLCPHL